MQDAANTQPGPDPGVDLSAKASSRFLAAAGLVVDAAGGTRVAGHIDLGPDHHTPWGVVHGGVYTTAAETAASLGASLAVRDRGQFAVGVHNATDFLRPATSGRAGVIAEPLQQGRVQQLWLVTITDERGRASHVARSGCRTFRSPAPAQADERPRRAGSTPGPVAFSVQAPASTLQIAPSLVPAQWREARLGRTVDPLSYEPSRSGGSRVLPLVSGSSARSAEAEAALRPAVVLMALPGVLADPASELRSKREVSRVPSSIAPAIPAGWRRSKTSRTAIEPSPMAAAARLTDPLRTSPTAKIPGSAGLQEQRVHVFAVEPGHGNIGAGEQESVAVFGE